MVSVSDGETLIGHPYSEAPSPESAEERASPGDDERVLRFKNYVESQLKILALKKEYIITLVRTKKAYR